MLKPEKLPDLASRSASALALIFLGFWGIWIGGFVFQILVSIVCGVMIWELVVMLVPSKKSLALQLGSVTGASLLLSLYFPNEFILPLLTASFLVGISQLSRNRIIYLLFSIMIVISGFAILFLRNDFGLIWVVWLVTVVVMTDISGYFAGRLIGGPKFWPQVSPKKTWSGTIAGWLGAGFVGALFMVNLDFGPKIIGISVAVSMASQLGDIAESALKRKMLVKDSSNLIPGHGGVLDRFDGMLGASIFLFTLWLKYGAAGDFF